MNNELIPLILALVTIVTVALVISALNSRIKILLIGILLGMAIQTILLILIGGRRRDARRDDQCQTQITIYYGR